VSDRSNCQRWLMRRTPKAGREPAGSVACSAGAHFEPLREARKGAARS